MKHEPTKTFSATAEAMSENPITTPISAPDGLSKKRWHSEPTERIILGSAGKRQLAELLKHPELFQAAHDRMKKELEQIDISECLKAPL